MKSTRTRVAAAATILGLGGLAGIALNAGNKVAPPAAVKPLVRTKVIRQTVHVTKHIKPKRPAAGGTPGSPYRTSQTVTEPVGGVTTAASSTGSSPPPSSTAAPVTTSSSGAAAAPSPSPESAPVVTHTSGSHAGSGGSGGTVAPVVTHTSGAGGGGEEHEGGDRGD